MCKKVNGSSGSELKGKQARLTAEYERLHAEVQAVAEATKGALRTQVARRVVGDLAVLAAFGR